MSSYNKVKDFIKKRFTKKKIWDIFIFFLLLLLFIVLRIISPLLEERYNLEIFTALTGFAELNIIILGTAFFVVLLKIFVNPELKEYSDQAIQNHQLSKMKVKKNFDKLVEKHVIKNDEQYQKFSHRKKIMGYILLAIGLISISGYIPIFLLEEELLSLLQTSEFFETISSKGLHISKLMIEFILMVPFAIIHLNSAEKVVERKEELAKDYQLFLQKEIGVKRRITGTKDSRGKGVILKKDYDIDLTKISKEALSPEEEIALLHDHAKYLSNKYRTHRNIIGIGLIVALEVFILYGFLMELLTLPWPLIIYLFFVVFTVFFVIENSQRYYYKTAHQVLGAYLLPGEGEERFYDFLKMVNNKGIDAAIESFTIDEILLRTLRKHKSDIDPEIWEEIEAKLGKGLTV